MEQLDIFCPHCGERLIYRFDKRRTLPHVVKCPNMCVIGAATSKEEVIKDARIECRLPVICTDGSTVPPHEPIK
jgi:hypothetical protein